jgi:hypothetical protein
MKFLLVKSLLGFGDRLESLIMCVSFAQKYNLKLLIDWSDPVWGNSFYSYFKLDHPTFALTDITNDMTVYPNYWKGCLDKKLTDEIRKSYPELEIGQLITPYSQDVIVTICVGMRTLYIDNLFFSNVFTVIDPRVVNEVRQRQQKYNLKDKWCIHLRGTDRFNTLEKKTQRFQELFIKLISHGLFSHRGGCVLISDDQEFVNLWITRDKKSPILSTIIDSKGKGLHYASPETLGISKDQQNVNLLIDFFTMASCKQVFSTS